MLLPCSPRGGEGGLGWGEIRNYKINWNWDVFLSDILKYTMERKYFLERLYLGFHHLIRFTVWPSMDCLHQVKNDVIFVLVPLP